MTKSPTENMKVHIKDEENGGTRLERSPQIEAARAIDTPHLINDIDSYNIRLRDLSSKLDPVFKLMKITGTFHGDNSLDGIHNQQRYSSRFFRFYCVFLTLCQWILVAKTVISLFFEGFSELRNFYVLLVYGVWYFHGAVIACISLVVLPKRKRVPSRLSRFVTNLLRTASDFSGITEKSVYFLIILACSYALCNILCIILLDVCANVSPARFRPWNGLLPYRVLHILFAASVSCSWVMPSVLFCVSSAILAGMFESLKKDTLSDPSTCVNIQLLRQDHLRLCETVALADSVFAPLLLMTLALDIPLLCIGFFQLVRSPSSKVIFIFIDSYWCVGVIAKLAIILKYGVGVNEKVMHLSKI